MDSDRAIIVGGGISCSAHLSENGWKSIGELFQPILALWGIGSLVLLIVAGDTESMSFMGFVCSAALGTFGIKVCPSVFHSCAQPPKL